MPVETLCSEERSGDESCGKESSGSSPNAFQQLTLTVDGSNGLFIDEALGLVAQSHQDGARAADPLSV